MKRSEYQAVVVGGGSGGYAAAAALADYGLRTVLIDKAEELGGLCILHGCMPSKALIESANLMRRMRNSGEFGIHTSDLKVSMEEVQDRKQRLIDGFQKYRVGQLEGGGFDLIRGEGVFSGEREIEVRDKEDNRKITFEYAVIATGSVPVIPKIEGLDQVDYWLSRDALDTRELPDHLVIVGGGAIGCEMAHCFEGLGSKVTIMQRTGCLVDDLGGDISEVIRKVSQQRGIEVLCSTAPSAVRKSGGQIVVEYENEGGRSEISGSHLLVATGRKPATEGLGLEQAGIETEDKRVTVNRLYQTSRAHIFAIGDAGNEQPVVHKAVTQGEEVARNIAIECGKLDGEFQASLGSENELFGVFTHPQCARAGMSDAELSDSGLETESARYDFADHGKAEILGETAGFVKITCEKGTGRILSASAVGPEVIDLIHEIQVAIHAGMSVTGFSKVPHYHPTLAEIWTYPAEELSDNR
jgi:pyruvate/2-oxoglutarate dehydrogenase complex dihydrolipoamide dehydrogenase (E3) component